MELREIAPGAYACLQEDRGWGWSNSGFVSAGGGLVIDTLMDLGHTRKMLDLYAGVIPDKPRRLVNTHHNVDHCWGNQLLADAEIIGHRECAARMAGDLSPEAIQAMISAPDLSPGARWFADDLADFDFSGITLTPPTTLLDGDTELDLGGVSARILYVGPAHTAGDVIVHLPEQNVVYVGDVVFHRCTPIGWEGTFAGWIAALDRIVGLAPETIVPGHGPLCDVEGVRELRAYFEYVYAESRRYYDQELPALEAARKIDLGPYAAWTQPERLIFNVERAYREFRGGAWDENVEVMRLLEDAWTLGQHYRGGRA
ncbi:MAG: MBL fold metallo-hydrolase [Proteobacteria bacterium]|nr:MBL fold metallo-hydrolase [Pseudomonadota bacterium]